MSATVAAPTQVSRSVPADLHALMAVRDALTDALAGRGWPAPEAFRVLVCADEATANAATHGATTSGTIDVNFTVDDAHATVTVRDHHPHPTVALHPTIPEITNEHGRGLILMHALADELSVEPLVGGTCVTVTIHRSPE